MSDPSGRTATMVRVAASAARPVASAIGPAPIAVAPAAALLLAVVGARAGWQPDSTATVATLVCAAPAGFLLDDPASVTLAASPTSLARRRSLRIALGLVAITIGWLLVLHVHETRPPGTLGASQLCAELLAVTLASLAIGARTGGASATMLTPLLALVATVLGTRYSWAPSLMAGPDQAARWYCVAVMSATGLAWSSRDPAART